MAKSTAFTFGTLLAIYLTGIASGAWLGSIVAPRLRRPTVHVSGRSERNRAAGGTAGRYAGARRQPRCLAAAVLRQLRAHGRSRADRQPSRRTASRRISAAVFRTSCRAAPATDLPDGVRVSHSAADRADRLFASRPPAREPDAGQYCGQRLRHDCSREWSPSMFWDGRHAESARHREHAVRVRHARIDGSRKSRVCRGRDVAVMGALVVRALPDAHHPLGATSWSGCRAYACRRGCHRTIGAASRAGCPAESDHGVRQRRRPEHHPVWRHSYRARHAARVSASGLRAASPSSGLGSGDTVYGVAGRPDIERITCVEIIAPQIDGLRQLQQRQPYGGLQGLLRRPAHRSRRRRRTHLPDALPCGVRHHRSRCAAPDQRVLGQSVFRGILHARAQPPAAWRACGHLAADRNVCTTPSFASSRTSSVRPVCSWAAATRSTSIERRSTRRIADPRVREHYARAGIDVKELMSQYLADPARYTPDFDRRTLTDFNSDLFPKRRVRPQSACSASLIQFLRLPVQLLERQLRHQPFDWPVRRVTFELGRVALDRHEEAEWVVGTQAQIDKRDRRFQYLGRSDFRRGRLDRRPRAAEACAAGARRRRPGRSPGAPAGGRRAP